MRSTPRIHRFTKLLTDKYSVQSISHFQNRNQTIPWSVGLAGLIYVTQYALELAEVFPLNGRKRRRRRDDDEDEGIYGQVGMLRTELD